jgi:hypothetical protein
MARKSPLIRHMAIILVAAGQDIEWGRHNEVDAHPPNLPRQGSCRSFSNQFAERTRAARQTEPLPAIHALLDNATGGKFRGRGMQPGAP